MKSIFSGILENIPIYLSSNCSETFLHLGFSEVEPKNLGACHSLRECSQDTSNKGSSTG